VKNAVSKADIEKCFALGMTGAATAQALGTSYGSLRYRCINLGIQMPKRVYERKLPPTDELIGRLRAGETPKSIALESGTSLPAVYGALRRVGLVYRGGVIHVDVGSGSGTMAQRIARISRRYPVLDLTTGFVIPSIEQECAR
jgi:hypothetical protein